VGHCSVSIWNVNGDDSNLRHIAQEEDGHNKCSFCLILIAEICLGPGHTWSKDGGRQWTEECDCCQSTDVEPFLLVRPAHVLSAKGASIAWDQFDLPVLGILRIIGPVPIDNVCVIMAIGCGGELRFFDVGGMSAIGRRVASIGAEFQRHHRGFGHVKFWCWCYS
jgi:hypothetical protein